MGSITVIWRGPTIVTYLLMDPTAVTHRGLILLLPSAKCPLGFHCCHPEGSHHCHLLYAPVGPTAVTHRGPIISQVAPCHYSHPEGSHCHHMPLTAVTHRCLILWHHLLYGPMGPTAVTRRVPPLSPATCPCGSHQSHPGGSHSHHMPAVPIHPTAVTRRVLLPPLAIYPYSSYCCHQDGSTVVPCPVPLWIPLLSPRGVNPTATTC